MRPSNQWLEKLASHAPTSNPMRHALAFAAAGSLAMSIGCSDYRYAFWEGPPTGEKVTMPPPIAFSACRDATRRHQRIDADGDGRTDTIRVVSADDEVEVCRGSDTNGDGRIDTWDVVENGHVTKRAHDSDNDGKVDQIWTWPDAKKPACALVTTDKDGDGKGDGATVDMCAALGSKADTPPPLAPLAVPTSVNQTPTP
jgi:hypothetical protein